MKKLVSLLFIFALLTFTLEANAEPHSFYGSRLCGYPQFTCIKVKRGDSWKKLFPNAYQREIVMRLNRTNVALAHRQWIVVPTHIKQINYLDLAPFPLKVDPSTERLVVVNLSTQAFAAYDPEGKLVHWGPISAGRDWCKDVGGPCQTAVGNFRIFDKHGPECQSTTFPVNPLEPRAPMPYCMHYFKGFALHGAALPGFHASHGCIRLFAADAKWLNLHFANIGTRVVVMY